MRVLTLGTFDILHYGHINLLNQVKRYAYGGFSYDGGATVGLNTDGFVKRYRGTPPIMTYSERELAIHKSVTGLNIVPNDQKDGTIRRVIEEARPTLIVVGSDWLEKDYLKQIGLTQDYLIERGISITFVPYTPGISSTEIKRRIVSQ